MTVTDVANAARALLNDVGGQLFTDTVMLPYIRKAYNEAQRELNINGVSTTLEVSALQTVAAGDNPVLTDNEINDLIIPLELSERSSGSNDFFTPMHRIEWEPDIDKQDSLIYWTWRENEIKFRGATSNRQVKVKYRKSLTAITSGSSNIAILSAEEFMASRSASIAAFIAGNNSKADMLNADASEQLKKMVAIEIKATQNVAVRRRPFRAHGRRVV